jgi:hypothetical protein
VAWVQVDESKDIQNPSLDWINVVEPRVTKVVIVAPSKVGIDVELIRHEK